MAIRSLGLVAAALIGAMPAAAAVVWDNGHGARGGGYCDGTGSDYCVGGFTIYDDFQLTATTGIKRLTYDVFFYAPASSYFATNITVWENDPSTSFAQGPAVSITGFGSTSPAAHGFTRITISDLALTLGAGSYWLGLQVVTNPIYGTPTGYAETVTHNLGGAIQIGDNGGFIVTGLNDAAFTLSSTVPEPASWALMIAGFGLAGATLRRSRVRAATA